MPHHVSQRPAGNSRLNDAEVKSIRLLYDSGRYSQTQLADMFKISTTAVNNVVNRKVHKDIE